MIHPFLIVLILLTLEYVLMITLIKPVLNNLSKLNFIENLAWHYVVFLHVDSIFLIDENRCWVSYVANLRSSSSNWLWSIWIQYLTGNLCGSCRIIWALFINSQCRSAHDSRLLSAGNFFNVYSIIFSVVAR